MIDHGSTSLPECGPTEYPVPKPCFIGLGKSLPILYGPLISVEMKINYSYLHECPQKYKSTKCPDPKSFVSCIAA